MTKESIKKKLAEQGLTEKQVEKVYEIIEDLFHEAAINAHWRDWDHGD